MTKSSIYFRAFKISHIKDIDQKEIKRRYKILSKKYHPDMGGTNDQFRFVKDAYDYVLERRKEFENKETKKFFNNSFYFYGNGSIYSVKIKKWVRHKGLKV